VAGAGRTDAGVHALGQVASFALGSAWNPADLMRAINAVLPEDVRALEASSCEEAFHARRSATSKLYRYTLDTGPVQLPTRRRFAGHVPWILDGEAVQRRGGPLPRRARLRVARLRGRLGEDHRPHRHALGDDA
jgi:tRNA pseudouridine38-40 synthase